VHPDLETDSMKKWRSSLSVIVSGAIGSLVLIISWYWFKEKHFVQWDISFFVCVFLALLVYFKKNQSKWIHVISYFFSIGTILAANVLTNYQLANAGESINLFGAFKITAFAIALIAPSPRWVAKGIILFCGLGPVVFYYALFPNELRGLFSSQEPFSSAIYATVAYIVYIYRMKADHLKKVVEKERYEKEAATHLAKIVLGIRDLTNSPIQTIELVCDLLRRGRLTNEEAANRLCHTLDRLRELSEVLKSYEKALDWQRDDISFDSKDRVNK